MPKKTKGQPSGHLLRCDFSQRSIWLCCKNNSVGETEPTAKLVGRLFRLQSEDLTDELNLPKDIPLRQPPHLAFPDHVQNLVALNRPPRSIERSKPLAGIHPPFDRSMVLFHNIV
jgi:hypothetical protein